MQTFVSWEGRQRLFTYLVLINVCRWSRRQARSTAFPDDSWHWFASAAQATVLGLVWMKTELSISFSWDWRCVGEAPFLYIPCLCPRRWGLNSSLFVFLQLGMVAPFRQSAIESVFDKFWPIWTLLCYGVEECLSQTWNGYLIHYSLLNLLIGVECHGCIWILVLPHNSIDGILYIIWVAMSLVLWPMLS